MAGTGLIEPLNGGYIFPTFAEVQQKNLTRYRNDLGSIPNNNDNSIKQDVDAISEREKSVDDAVELLWNSNDTDNVSGIFVDNLLGLNGLIRLVAAQSTVSMSMVGTPSAVIPGNRLVKIQDGATNEGEMFRILSGWTFNAAGNATVTAVAESYGAIDVDANTLTEIVAGASGWTSANNADVGNPGRLDERDSEALLRREVSLQKPGAGTNGSIESNVRQNVSGVTYTKLFSNNSDATKNGTPKWSDELVVVGGEPQDIVDTIWDYKSSLAATFGNVTLNVTDDNGDPQPVSFTRPENVNIWQHITLSVNDKFNAGTKQTNIITVDTAVVGQQYTVILNGNTYTHTAIGGDTVTTIAAALSTLISTGPYIPISKTYFATDNMTLTAIYPGNPFDATATDNMTLVTTVENSGDQIDIISNCVSFAHGDLIIDSVDGGYYFPGDNVLVDDFGAPIKLTKNIDSFTVYLGTAVALPTAEDDIPITMRELAAFLSYRVSVEVI